MIPSYSYNMEKQRDLDDNIHKLTIAELLGTIDHKVRGIQQLLIALRELTSDSSISSSLDHVMKGTKELQAIYQDFLKIRILQEETIQVDEFLRTTLNVSPKCSGSINIDREKLAFICNTILEFGGEECKVSSESSQNGCVIKFSSPVFREFRSEDFKSVPLTISHLPLYAVKRITEKMEGVFSIEGDETTVEFSYYTPEY